MKNNFRKDVSESLKRLHFVLMKKAESQNLSEEQLQKSMKYLNFLQIVAANTAAYCDPAYFDKNMAKLGFDVATDFNLFSLDEHVAQCVYDVMVCWRDYICHTNKQNAGKNKLRLYNYDFVPYKYKSQQEAIEAMRLFKHDSIQMAGGVIPCAARSFWKKLFSRTK